MRALSSSLRRLPRRRWDRWVASVPFPVATEREVGRFGLYTTSRFASSSSSTNVDTTVETTAAPVENKIESSGDPINKTENTASATASSAILDGKPSPVLDAFEEYQKARTFMHAQNIVQDNRHGEKWYKNWRKAYMENAAEKNEVIPEWMKAHPKSYFDKLARAGSAADSIDGREKSDLNDEPIKSPWTGFQDFLGYKARNGGAAMTSEASKEMLESTKWRPIQSVHTKEADKAKLMERLRDPVTGLPRGKGVTVVLSPEDAKKALEILKQHENEVAAWDTESAGINFGNRKRVQSPLHDGKMIVASCYIGDHVDFGNGPLLFIDNYGQWKNLPKSEPASSSSAAPTAVASGDATGTSSSVSSGSSNPAIESSTSTAASALDSVNAVATSKRQMMYEDSKVIHAFKSYFENPKYQKVFHNYAHDYKVLYREGISVQGFHADTLHLARLEDSSLGNWEQDVRNLQAECENDQELAEAAADGMFNAGVLEVRDPLLYAVPDYLSTSLSSSSSSTTSCVGTASSGASLLDSSDISAVVRQELNKRPLPESDKQFVQDANKLVRKANDLDRLNQIQKRFQALAQKSNAQKQASEKSKKAEKTSEAQPENETPLETGKKGSTVVIEQALASEFKMNVDRRKRYFQKRNEILQSDTIEALSALRWNIEQDSMVRPNWGSNTRLVSNTRLDPDDRKDLLKILKQRLKALKTSHTNKGYGLKHLVKIYDIERQPQFFQDIVANIPRAIRAEDRIEYVHTNEELYAPAWVNYASSDAMYTKKLFEELKRRLQTKQWASDVREHIVQNLDTSRKGHSMWQFYEEFYRPFGELLKDMQVRGTPVCTEHLDRIEKDAEEAEIRHRAKLEKLVEGYVDKPHLLNLSSSIQMRVLLYGGGHRTSKGGRMSRRPTEKIPETQQFQVITESEGPTTTNPAGSISPEITKTKETLSVVKSMGFSKYLQHWNAEGTSVKYDENPEHWSTEGWPSSSRTTLLSLAEKLDNQIIELNQMTSWPPKFTREYVPLEKLAADLQAKIKEAETKKEFLLSLMECKQANSMLAYFIRPLKALAKKGAGSDGSGEQHARIHPSLMLDTSTGRLCCRAPNLQNQPAFDKDVYQIRKAIKAPPKRSLVVCDYSQLELRVVAHLANCDSMKKNFNNGGDFHTETAIEMYDELRQLVDEGKISKAGIKEKHSDKRKAAKTMNFGIAYGRSAYSIAYELDKSIEEAKNDIERWYNSKTQVRQWKMDAIKNMRLTETSLSLFGRQRRLPLIVSSDFRWRARSERAGVNHMVQGSAADIVMLGMLELSRDNILSKKLGYNLVLQIHDEVILEGPEENAEAALQRVKAILEVPWLRMSEENVPQGNDFFNPALEVSGSTAQTWYDCK